MEQSGYFTRYLCDAPGCIRVPAARKSCTNKQPKDQGHVCLRSSITQTVEHILRSQTTQDKMTDLDTSYQGRTEIPALPELPPVIVDVNTGAKPSQLAL